MHPPPLLTIGEIVRRTGQPLHRVEYLIRARNIKPDSRAGATRVFSEATADFIASELRRLDREREESMGVARE